MKYKSEIFERFRELKYEIEKQIDKPIKVLQSDQEKYLSTEFLRYLKENGIVSQWTPFDTPQLNRVSERKNRTLLNMIRSMMSSTNLFLFLWGYTLLTTMHILNRILTKSIPTIPYEI